MWKTRRMSGQPDHIYQLADWSRLEAALSLIWRWRGVLEGALAEAAGSCFSLRAAPSDHA